MTRLRPALPWVVGALIVAFLLRSVDPVATWAALRGADLRLYVPISAGFAIFWLLLDTAVLQRLFAVSIGELGFREMLRVRAATYPLMIVSYHLASAALVARLESRRRTGWSTLTGALLVHYLTDLVALCGTALVASLAIRQEFLPALRPLLAMILVAATLALLLSQKLSELTRGPRWLGPVHRWVVRLKPLPVLDLAWIVAGRVVWYASFALFVWTTAPLFSLQLPLVEAAARIPVVLCIAALPIAPAGIGTTQAAMLALLAPFGSAAERLAYGLAYGATLILMRLPLGCFAWLPAAAVPRCGTSREVPS